MHTFTKMVT